MDDNSIKKLQQISMPEDMKSRVIEKLSAEAETAKQDGISQKPSVYGETRTPRRAKLIPLVAVAAAAAVAVPLAVNFTAKKDVIGASSSKDVSLDLVTESSESSEINESAPESNAGEITPEAVDCYKVIMDEYNSEWNRGYGDRNVYGTNKLPENLADYITPINIAKTQNGVTISLYGVVNIGGYGHVVMSCDVDDEKYKEYEGLDIEGHCGEKYAHLAERGSDLHLMLVDLPENADSCTLSFDSVLLTDSTVSKKFDISGMEFEIPINHKAYSAKTKALDTDIFLRSGCSAKLTEVEITPFYAVFTVEGYDNNGFSIITDLKLKMKDGSYAMGLILGEDGGRAVYIMMRPIDPDEVIGAELVDVSTNDATQISFD